MNNFSDLVTSPVLRANLARQAFKEPTPVQAQAIPPALLGKDIVATAQTGTGKTLAFALPIIERLAGLGKAAGNKPQALILSPTRELAIQIDEAFSRIGAGSGIRSAVVVGGMSESKQLQTLRRGAQVIIATPGRLCDFLDRKLVSLETVSIVVLDEADRMLDMGFLPAVESILKKTAAQKQTLSFSATLEGGAERLIHKYMKDPVRITVGSTTRPADSIEMHVYEVDADRKVGLLHAMLDNETGSFLVFARTKHGAERLAKKVSGLGFKAAAIHGDRSQNQRNMALKGFQDGFYRVLVATDVAARGIHVDNIAHVVNFDLPQAPEDFIHRVGRTGRAGSQGIATTFATSNERNEIRTIERTLKLKLIRKETPEGIDREVRSSGSSSSASPSVIVMPRPNGFRPKSQSFKPRRSRFAGAGR
jgi:ATP-dependent RNA helicase RhlE